MALRADDVDLDRDRALVRRFQAGDDDAFDELYRRYHDRLERFCRKRVGDRHTAEELTQEAFTRALTALPALGGEMRFYPWVSVIAARLCVDTYRHQLRSEPASDPDPGPVSGGEEAIVDAVDASLAVAALARLAPRHQDVLHLREVEGWSYQHIADHYGVTVGTVETLLFRARRALRREFHMVDRAGLMALPVVGWLLRWRRPGPRPRAPVAAVGSVAPRCRHRGHRRGGRRGPGDRARASPGKGDGRTSGAARTRPGWRIRVVLDRRGVGHHDHAAHRGGDRPAVLPGHTKRPARSNLEPGWPREHAHQQVTTTTTAPPRAGGGRRGWRPSRGLPPRRRRRRFCRRWRLRAVGAVGVDEWRHRADHTSRPSPWPCPSVALAGAGSRPGRRRRAAGMAGARPPSTR